MYIIKKSITGQKPTMQISMAAIVYHKKVGAKTDLRGKGLVQLCSYAGSLLFSNIKLFFFIIIAVCNRLFEQKKMLHLSIAPLHYVLKLFLLTCHILQKVHAKYRVKVVFMNCNPT